MRIKNIFKGVFGGGVPTSYVYNYGIMGSLVSKTDVLDFYTGWVFGCTNKRATGLATIDFKLYEKKGNNVEEVLSHEILELLYRINPQQTKFDFMQLSVIYLDLFGVSPWYVHREVEGGNPTQMYLLRPEYLKMKTDKQGQAVGYKYQIGTFVKEFSADEIMYLKNPNPADPTKGMGIIESVRGTVLNEDYITQSNNNLLKNSARPSGVIEADGEIDKTVAKRLKKSFKSNYQGYDNVGDVMVFGNGAKFKALSLPPKDLDFIESKRMNRDEILSMFGVPKPIMGIYDDVNLASAKTAEYIFAKWTLEPLMTKYTEQLNEFLLPMFKNSENLWLDFEPIAKEDEELALRKREAGYNKWLTTNEVREMDGFAPINGGDYIYMPFSVMPTIGGAKSDKKEYIKLKSERKSVAPQKAKEIIKRINNRNLKIDKASEKVADIIVNKLKSDKIVKVVKKKAILTKKGLNSEQIETFYKARMEEEVTLENNWRKAFIELFNDQRDRFVNAVETGQKAVIENYGIDVESEIATTITVIEPLMYESLMVGTRQASELIGESTVVDMDYIKDWLDTAKVDVATSITNTTVEKFSKIIEDGANDGLSNAKIAQQVSDVFDKVTEYRADMIARTETARAVTESHRKTYEHYGFFDVKWLLEAGACEICVDKESQKWNINTIQGQIPGDTHPNCKCDFTPI